MGRAGKVQAAAVVAGRVAAQGAVRQGDSAHVGVDAAAVNAAVADQQFEGNRRFVNMLPLTLVAELFDTPCRWSGRYRPALASAHPAMGAGAAPSCCSAILLLLETRTPPPYDPVELRLIWLLVRVLAAGLEVRPAAVIGRGVGVDGTAVAQGDAGKSAMPPPKDAPPELWSAWSLLLRLMLLFSA